MRVFFIAAAVLALVGCANQEPVLVSPTAPTVVASESTMLTPQTKMTCHKETSIGSNMIHTVCETEQSATDRIATQEMLRHMAPPAGTNH